jgi:hypothetical protein
MDFVFEFVTVILQGSTYIYWTQVLRPNPSTAVHVLNGIEMHNSRQLKQPLGCQLSDYVRVEIHNSFRLVMECRQL